MSNNDGSETLVEQSAIRHTFEESVFPPDSKHIAKQCTLDIVIERLEYQRIYTDPVLHLLILVQTHGVELTSAEQAYLDSHDQDYRSNISYY